MQNEASKKTTGKKVLWWAVSIVLVIALAVVAVFTSPKLQSAIGIGGNSATFAMTVTVDGETVVFDDTLTAKEGETLIDTMTRGITADGGVVFEESTYGAYITSICGYAQDDSSGKYWAYYVNGEYAQVGASEYIPAEGDEILFDLSAMEW